jgi:hypothetical protein
LADREWVLGASALVRNALVLLAEEAVVAVAVVPAEVAGLAAAVFELADAAAVVAFETLTTGAVVRPAVAVETVLIEHLLLAAPDPAAFDPDLLRRRLAGGAETEQAADETDDGSPPAGRVAGSAGSAHRMSCRPFWQSFLRSIRARGRGPDPERDKRRSRQAYL